ncbi:MAG: hypothetical protein HOB33_05850 [Bacteroidetes Order II. Incertae sedis bacterium]|nr:hypothetical protein [Bacteroidetes Order II. bacterium]
MRYNNWILLLALVCVLITTKDATAQVDPELPDLAPRELEITGDLSIVFPALRRQPIVGFNPPPRVPDIPGQRMPFADPYKQPSAELPPSPLVAPNPPDVNALATRVPITGVIEGSLGKHLNRSVTADLALASTKATSVLLSGAYRGSNGIEPFSGSDASSGFDHLNGMMTLSHAMTNAQIETSIAGFRNGYSLYGAGLSAGSLALNNPERIFSGAHARIALSSLPGSRIQLTGALDLGMSSIGTDIFDPAIRVDPSSERDESYLDFSTAASFPIRDGNIRIVGNAVTSGLDDSGFPGSTVQSGYSEVALAYLYSKNLFLEGGLAAFGFASDAQTDAGRSQSLSYLSPVLKATYSISPSISWYAGNTPSITSHLMKDAFKHAPFLMDEPLLLPTLTALDAHTGMSLMSEYVTGQAQFGWKDQPFRRFAHRPSAGLASYDRGYAALAYDDASMFYGRLDLAFILRPGFQFGVDLEFRNAELTELKSDIPYFSPLTAGGFLSASFMDGSALIQMNWRPEGLRPVNLTGTTETQSLTLISLSGTYFVSPAYGVSLGVRNLGSQPEFWDNYTSEASTVFFGAQYRW